MRRGEIWWVDFSSARGSEIKKDRPAIVVSNDASNKHLNRIQVVPVTSKIGKLFPSEAYVTIKGKQKKAMADQIDTVSKDRIKNKVGRLKPLELKRVEQAIIIQLGLK